MTKDERIAAVAREKMREKDHATIEQKKREAEEARMQYVRDLLELEQKKYGLKRQGIPLSRMPI